MPASSHARVSAVERSPYLIAKDFCTTSGACEVWIGLVWFGAGSAWCRRRGANLNLTVTPWSQHLLGFAR